MVQEVIFLRKFLDNLGFKQNGPTPIFADNETCIHWSEGSVGGSDRAKHIDLRKHFVHDACQQGILKLTKIDSELNGASSVILQNLQSISVDSSHHDFSSFYFGSVWLQQL